MQFFAAHKIRTAILAVLVFLVVLVILQFLYIKLNGTAVSVLTIPRGPEQFGQTGPTLNYVVMGDSTAVGQGADYSKGIARYTANYLARSHQVILTNVGVSGARVADVLNGQVAKAVALKPDVVLLAIGANDVTHTTNLGSIEKDLTNVITQLQAANPHIQIVMTGSPAMGSVPRFAKPTQWLVGWQERRVNRVIAKVAADKHVVLVPLAAETEQTFLDHPEYFASDKFHPNADGYAVWFPVLTRGFTKLGL